MIVANYWNTIRPRSFAASSYFNYLTLSHPTTGSTRISTLWAFNNKQLSHESLYFRTLLAFPLGTVLSNSRRENKNINRLDSTGRFLTYPISIYHYWRDDGAYLLIYSLVDKLWNQPRRSNLICDRSIHRSGPHKILQVHRDHRPAYL